MKKPHQSGLSILRGGGSGEIRTHERRKTLPVFKTGAIDHSATLPVDAILSARCSLDGLPRHGALNHNERLSSHGFWSETPGIFACPPSCCPLIRPAAAGLAKPMGFVADFGTLAYAVGGVPRHQRR